MPYYVGVEIGGTKLQVGLGPGDGTLAALWRGRVDAAAGAEGIRRQLGEAVPALLAQGRVPAADLRGVGVGFGGPVDQRAQRVIRSHQIAGWDDFDLDELMEIGERRINLLRAFNAREGIDRAADTLPAKFFRPLTGTGPTKGVALDPAAIADALDEYYRLAGWDRETGNPTPETLARLGLAAIA